MVEEKKIKKNTIYKKIKHRKIITREGDKKTLKLGKKRAIISNEPFVKVLND
jgi:hypothetical protein